MKKINLRELYPDVYTTDFLVDVTEEVMETIRAAERVLYYRTRIKDANGKLVAIYAKTPEELYNKETFALEQINLYCSRQRTIMYSVKVHNGLYDTKRGRRKMGRDRTMDKLLLHCGSHPRCCKNGDDLADSENCGKAD